MSSLHSPLSTPDPLAGITLLEELGHGSASVVHRARRGHAEFAVKVLRDRPDSPAERTAYQREAAVFSTVRHPGLVQIHAVGELDGRPALVMDLVAGETLQSLLAQHGALDESTAVGIARDAAGALAAAHATGLVHRDVKPGNLIVQPDGRARLIDFGLVARAGIRQSRDATIGTVRYSPPEQTGLLGRAIDGRSDLYALGVVLYEMLAGRAPFEAGDVGELVRLHAAVPAPDIREFAPDTSPALAAVVARLLAKDPDDRFQTADGLVRDLTRIAAGDPGESDFEIGGNDDPRAAMHDGPLVGRDEELNTLQTRWRRAQQGHGGAVLVTGAAGSGKRRLVRELVADATRHGALDLSGRALQSDGTPLAPLREAIDRYLDGIAALQGDARERALRELRAAADAAGDLIAALSPRIATLTDCRPAALTSVTGEQHAGAIARFLVELATQHGSAILRLEDAPSLDETTVRVLAEIAAELRDAPLLVVVSAREDAPAAALAPVESALGDLLDTRIAVGPLTESGTRELVSGLLSGVDVDATLVAQLHTRSGGNPFATQEYVRAIIYAGLVRPTWGTLLIDLTGLDQLALPDDVMGLVIARVDGLSTAARHLLAAAAVSGSRFSPTIAADAAGLDAFQGADACTEILAERLVERRDGGSLAFLHERVREAVLAPIAGDDRRALHRRLANALEVGVEPETAPPDIAFAMARHLAEGSEPGTAERRLTWTLRAADAALEGHGARQAAELFSAAQTAAREVGRGLGLDAHERWSVALLRVGDVAESDRHADRVLSQSEDPLQQARVLLRRSNTRFGTFEAGGAEAAAQAGLAALGRSLPTGRLRRFFRVIASLVLGLAMLATRRGLGAATDEERPALALEVDLLRAAAQASYIRMRPLEVTARTFLALPRAVRLGPSRQLVQTISAAAPILASFGAEGLSLRLLDGAEQAAQSQQDPGAVAYVALYRFLTLESAGRTRDAGEAAADLLAEHGRWLETADLLLAASTVAYNLGLRGHTREALRAWQSVHDRLVHASQAGVDENPYLLMGWISLETLGERSEAAQLRLAVRKLGLAESDNPYRHQLYLGALIKYLSDQNEYGDELISAVEDSDALGIDPRTANPWMQANFTQPFQIDVELASRAEDDDERAKHLASAHRRWKTIRKARCVPLFESFNLIAYADLQRIEGKPARSLRTLAKAEQLAIECDMPRAHCEIARIRGKIARDLNETAELRRQTQIAMRLAADQGWRGVLESLRREFGPMAGVVVGSASGSGAGSAPAGGSSSIAESRNAPMNGLGSAPLRVRRTLDALLSLSLASSHVHDGEELARVSLDHVVALLGAERGFLFLADEDTGELQLSAARSSSGEEVDLTSACWSRTVIEHVGRTREPVLITGSEEAAAIGAESAVQHGLRSILACPLLLEGRLLGVLNVDSRLARGIFGEGDGDILSAIGSHIAVALETARAAQLELAVATEREQRGLAEALRDAMTDVSSTLDPVEVLERTLERAWRLIPYDRAAVLLQDADGNWSVPAVSGDVELDAVRAAVESDHERPFLTVLAAPTTPEVASQVMIGGSPIERLLGPCGAWLTVPLIALGERAGLMLMASDEPGQLGDAQLDIAATFAGQGIIAHENARLFKAVERMATTDELTQVSNRRHFFELGETQFLTAQRYDLPFAALMLDIDHFKQVNDTYGHAAGDDVIREVASRLRGLIRTVDIIGRYGGEEFAFVLPCTGDDAVILARRLRETICATPIETREGELPITVSIGVAVYDRTDPHLASILGRADLALYDAKRLGRDRVEVAEQSVPG